VHKLELVNLAERGKRVMREPTSCAILDVPRTVPSA
jgi:hypothetical protein